MAKILVVEDDAALRDLYSQILRDEGYDVETAADGLAGYEAMSKGGYDLVLLDLVMPQMDGLMILSKLADHPPAAPNQAIVILSNLGKEDVVGQAIELGAKGYLIKSDYTPDQVVQQVKNFLSK